MRQKVKKNASGAPEVFIYENECLYIFLFFFFFNFEKRLSIIHLHYIYTGKRLEEKFE